MKKTLFISSVLVLIIVSACGRAAEDREMMHKRAKEFQDSIANVIHMSMQAAEMPAQGMPAPAPAPAATPSPQQAH